MRWDRLFDDLEAQLDHAAADELAAEITDRTRHEFARLRLVDRLRPMVGGSVDLTVEGAGPVHGIVRRVGVDWLLVEPGSGTEIVICGPAILTVRGLSAVAQDPASWGVVESRLDLGHVLRAVARDRSPVTVVLRDGSGCAGTIDRVGADFLELAEHAPDEPRRASRTRGMRAVALAGLAVVRPQPGSSG